MPVMGMQDIAEILIGRVKPPIGIGYDTSSVTSLHFLLLTTTVSGATSVYYSLLSPDFVNWKVNNPAIIDVLVLKAANLKYELLIPNFMMGPSLIRMSSVSEN